MNYRLSLLVSFCWVHVFQNPEFQFWFSTDAPIVLFADDKTLKFQDADYIDVIKKCKYVLNNFPDYTHCKSTFPQDCQFFFKVILKYTKLLQDFACFLGLINYVSRMSVSF